MHGQDLERSSAIVMACLSAVLIGTIVQIVSWDKYALTAIPLQFREVVFASSPSDWEAKSEMCWDLKDWDCVESAYESAARLDHQKYNRLGQYLMRRLKFEKAADSFSNYFQNGGKDREAAFAYAKALAEMQRDSESEKYFEIALNDKKSTLNVPVVISYVRLLMRNGKFARAQRLIETVRDQNPTGVQFMDSEYHQIKKLKTASRD